MKENFKPAYRFVKGTVEASFFDTATGDLVAFTNKLTEDNIETTVNLGEVAGGVGNSTLINIPDSAKLNLTLTAADFSLTARGLQVGSKVHYNGVHEVVEAVKAVGSELKLSNAVAPLGADKAYCYILPEGTAYEVENGTVRGFTAEADKTYCVKYSIQNPSAEQLDIKSLFAPAVVRAVIKLPTYSAENADPMTGSLVGYHYVTIPRMQFSGNAGVNASQTQAATTAFTGSALAYDPAIDAGSCDQAGMSILGYMTYVPNEGVEAAVKGLAVVGGAVEVAVGATVQCPVKYVMADETLVQPAYSQLTYVVADAAKATVDDKGVITGVAAGETKITVSTAGGIKTEANVVVSGA